MTVKFPTIPALICAALLTSYVMTSCKKDTDKPGPAPVIVDRVLTEQKLTGKWEAVYKISTLYDSALNTISYTEWKQGDGKYENGQGPINHYWFRSEDSYIDFNGDHTYRQYDYQNNAGTYMMPELDTTGSWSLMDTTLTIPSRFGPVAKNWSTVYLDSVVRVFAMTQTITDTQFKLTDVTSIYFLKQ